MIDSGPSKFTSKCKTGYFVTFRGLKTFLVGKPCSVTFCIEENESLEMKENSATDLSTALRHESLKPIANDDDDAPNRQNYVPAAPAYDLNRCCR